ncbi:MAG: hypothetical protein M1820_002129 [Bogoriella megaspora]|nr:MAG: hypothetical protein M1820_002129 [Bogoriella megaspora]
MSVNASIKPSLWFAGNAEEAVDFYSSIFTSSKVTNVARYTAAGKDEHGMEVGSIMSLDLTLNDQTFMLINGPPIFQFSQAISFTVTCEDQEEIDHYWEKLGDGGERARCGWLKDKFGLSWRVVPRLLDELLQKGDEEQRARVSIAKSKMGKFDIDRLKRAFEGY